MLSFIVSSCITEGARSRVDSRSTICIFILSLNVMTKEVSIPIN